MPIVFILTAKFLGPYFVMWSFLIPKNLRQGIFLTLVHILIVRWHNEWRLIFHQLDLTSSRKVWPAENPKYQISVLLAKLSIYSQLKFVHFKNPVTWSSFLSKALSFLLKSKQSQGKWQRFWKKWGLHNCHLKMNGL